MKNNRVDRDFFSLFLYFKFQQLILSNRLQTALGHKLQGSLLAHILDPIRRFLEEN